ncbi:MAG TPA: DUF4142 domain-containing protein [Chitinophagaceae bacterium]|jgi:putative membrane protein|nr:DUF4142 domain-containing protein [Chitinophagaceae bacterium]
MKKIAFAVATFAIFIACNNSSEKNETGDTSVVDNIHHPDGTVPVTDSPGNTTVNDTDREFALKAGMGNTGEIEAGQLAVQRANGNDVKEFGNMMIKDHGDAQSRLKGIAASLSLNAPDSVDQEHKDLKTKLSGLSGKAFDKEYITAQVKDHRATVTLFEKQISSGTNSQLKEFATSTLPHIKMHLEKAEALQAANK